MNEQEQSLAAIHDIKKMMERSSRFISLSGLSGVSAGICALAGAWLAHPYVYGHKELFIDEAAALALMRAEDYRFFLSTWLFWIAAGTFVAAVVSAFIFTYIKSRKEGIPVWGNSAKRLLLNVSIPMIVGAIFLFKLMHSGTFSLVAPGCLLFYGLALVNASKYTLNEIRFLGFGQVILGILNLFLTGYGLYFWAAGFGILHIIYGIYMWQKYELKK